MTPSPSREDPPALVRRDAQGGVATLTLQSPASRNALSLAMIEALISEFAAIGKRTFYRQIEAPLAEAYAVASMAMVENLAHPDAGEGVTAFLDKREPHWEDA
jgi:enoyl-CoA hydratase/carnithine racemase